MTGRWRYLAALLGLVALLLGATGQVRAEEEFLEPDQAFQFSARALDDRSVELIFEIAEGYYLYHEQFKFEAAPAATLAPAQMPAGKVKYDDTFKKDVETHRGRLLIKLPVEQAKGPFLLSVTSQGCADKGLCYPPMQHHAEVRLLAFGGGVNAVSVVSDGASPRAGGKAAPGVGALLGGMLGRSPAASTGGARVSALPASEAQPAASAATAPGTTPAATAGAGAAGARPADEAGAIERVLRSGRLSTVALAFFVAGLGLSLTPCVWPMLPILSSIIVGQADRKRGSSRRGRGLLLAASYSLGMALVYTAFGIAAALAGEGLAAHLQTPPVLIVFAALLVLLSLSMFGFYELQLPTAWRERLSKVSGRLPGGSMGGVFLMGGLSALIVSPCVAAPLAGALVYISQTRDVLMGGLALFMLAAGMSVPLLLIGASSGRWLPRGGAWMEHVKHFFGALLIAVALWIVQPVLPGWAAMVSWGSFLLIGAVYLRVFDPLHGGARGTDKLLKGLGVVLAVLGAMQLVGAASGGRDPLQPLGHLAARVPSAGAATAASAGPVFGKVSSVAELDQALASAGRPVMLDFYADWCVSCKEMERFTFTDPRVRDKLAGALLLKADVTANNEADRALLKRFGLFGPPGTLFFDAQGRELREARVIGFQSADRFVETLAAAGL
ncbi:protein-disulfide reductase DsbD [Eleftheria terrae]|uniref:protein-disulfide reductase DsbD n=1 Tax=Eleftheria terrae TaxID=1597781 RepID=UPI00263A53B8|nr:protein-disulfide reductase DsbD [Eleftheria terrae]WKB51616.1 protein-disulfide reductase DsbD [Eleftheria terrae]